MKPLVYCEGIEEILARGIDLRSEEAAHLYWSRIAASVAMLSLCDVARCGAAVVNTSLFIREPLFGGCLVSQGFNMPPGGYENKRCRKTQPSRMHPRADRTCCVHAEVKALLYVPRERLQGSTLYFARVDAIGSIVPSGDPYCTGCSKLALETGIAHWVLWHEDGPRRYCAREYNDLSHEFDERWERLERQDHRPPGPEFHAAACPAAGGRPECICRPRAVEDD